MHLGATKEVSSWELKLQNWDGKYSPNGLYPLNVGLDGYICIGRGVNVPQLITTERRTSSLNPRLPKVMLRFLGDAGAKNCSATASHKDYSGFKGEAIVKNLLDYYAGISHVRNGVELVADTDTTFTDLKVSDYANVGSTADSCLGKRQSRRNRLRF